MAIWGGQHDYDAHGTGSDSGLSASAAQASLGAFAVELAKAIAINLIYDGIVKPTITALGTSHQNAVNDPSQTALMYRDGKPGGGSPVTPVGGPVVYLP